ncbi:MAG: hypothetical protein OEV79_12245 [candidate division WOR-3 bacterium]|nr:hypothetical protein [candidate division WOR-3 bacterium]
MARDIMKKLRFDNRAIKKDLKFFAGIRARNDRRQLTKSKRAGLRNVGMVWNCSVLCLARCGTRIYAGPL